MNYFRKLFAKKNRDANVKEKVACQKCGAKILLTTARKYKGKCAPCAHGRDIAEEKRKRDVTKPLVLGGNDFKSFPRWALVAFAARCARRAQPALRAVSSSLLPEHIDAVEEAINVAGRAASTANSSVVDLRPVAEKVKAAIEATGGLQLVMGPLGPPQFAKSAVLAAEAALILIDSPDVQYAAASSNFAIAACYFIQADSSVPLPTTIYSSMRHDFEHLQKLCEVNSWTDNTPVTQDVFGPLWPEGVPKNWPE